MFGFIKEAIEAPFETAADMVKSAAKGDIGGVFMAPIENGIVDPAKAAYEDLGEAIEVMGKIAHELDVLGLGKVFEWVDKILDENPWLKQIIVAVAPLYGTAALAAIDIASQISQGDLTIEDLNRVAMESVVNYTSGRLAGMSGGAGLGTAAGKYQMASTVLTESGVLGEDGTKIARVAGIAANGDFSSASGIVTNGSEIAKESGVFGEENDKYFDALQAGASGDYSSTGAAISSGAEVFRESEVFGETGDRYLSGVQVAAGGDYSSTTSTAQTGIDVLQTSGVLGEDADRYLDTGEAVLNADTSSTDALVSSGAEIAEASGAVDAKDVDRITTGYAAGSAVIEAAR